MEKTVQSQKFKAVLRLEGKTATGIQVPTEIIAALGTSKRPAVRVTLKDHTYRTTVAAYGEIFMIPVAAHHREAAGLTAGDEVEVTIALDTEPREVTVPPDFSAALDKEPTAKKFFEGLSYSNKRRFVLSIEDAITDETRRRRIEKSVVMLREGKV